LEERQNKIHDKGFNMLDFGLQDLQNESEYNKIKVGVKSLDDAVVNLGTFRKVNRNYGDKVFILNAIKNRDYKSLREISKYFYEASGIYQRLCKYLAFLYRYDWYVTPYTNEKTNENKVLKDFSKVLQYFDDSNVKKVLGDIALEVIVSGSYYGFIIDSGDSFSIQQLPS
jgi:hypothetical protein